MKKKNFPDFTENYALLGKNGGIKVFEGGEKFWNLPPTEFRKIGDDWLITEFYFEEDWKTWEMHPHAEEIVYLLSGSMNLILEKDGVTETIELRSKGSVIIPPKTWHTAKVFAPSNILVITLGKDTEVRPFEQKN